MAKKSYEETYKTDPAKYLQRVSDIESGRVTRNEELYGDYGNGIGVDKKDDLEKMILMKQDPSTGPFFKQAVEVFDQMYAGTPEQKAKKPEFINLLKEEIRTGNLKGEAILQKGQALLKYAPKKTFDFFKPNQRMWERTIDERPWLKLDVTEEESKRPSAPLTGNTVRKSIQGVTDKNRTTFDAVPLADRATIVNYLRANNLPITDELILEGYKQMQEITGVPTRRSNDYDYAGYEAKYGPADQSKGQHLTDEFKLPNHITFSRDSKYSTPEKEGGEWKKIDGKWHFYASKFNLEQNSSDRLKKYFSEHEKDSVLHLPGENK